MQHPTTPRPQQPGRVAPSRADPTESRIGRGGRLSGRESGPADTDLMVRVSQPRMAVSFAVATWEQL